jgi:hypothetical protein
MFARERGGWMTDRHGQFPTLDFAVKSCPVIDDFLEPRLAETVLPSIGALYGIQVQDLTLDDLFVVKYEAHRQISGSSVEATPTRARSAHGMPPRSQQASLDAHYDETLLSFSVLLSNPEKDFKGGGTRFSSVQWSSALLEGVFSYYWSFYLFNGVWEVSARFFSDRFLCLNQIQISSLYQET